MGIKRAVGEPAAHHLSALTAVLLFTAYGLLVWKRTGIASAGQAVLVGVYWFALTVVAEALIVNRWMSKLTWQQILQTYKVERGDLWAFVLVWIGLLPLVLYRWRGPAQQL